MNKEQTAELREALTTFREIPKEVNRSETISKIIGIYAVEFAPEARDLVNSIESDPFPTTQYGYGRYLAAIGCLKGFPQLGLILAMKNAGAGQGLMDAAIAAGLLSR